MPNIENINKLIEVLKSDRAKNHFNMSVWLDNGKSYPPLPSEINKCGTVACIGGWCNVLQYEENPDKFYAADYQALEETDWLGLDDDSAHALFYSSVSFGITDPLDVIPVLEHLRDTGEVDWSLSPFLNSDNGEEQSIESSAMHKIGKECKHKNKPYTAKITQLNDTHVMCRVVQDQKTLNPGESPILQRGIWLRKEYFEERYQ